MATATTSISFSIRNDIAQRLSQYAQETELSKSAIINRALSNFFSAEDSTSGVKTLQDSKDLELAQKISQDISRGSMRTYTLEEVEKLLDL